jgi:hypothetical protein
MHGISSKPFSGHLIHAFDSQHGSLFRLPGDLVGGKISSFIHTTRCNPPFLPTFLCPTTRTTTLHQKQLKLEMKVAFIQGTDAR